MRIVTWNVNGIRAAIRKGFDKFVEKIDADVWMLQEVRCLPEQLPPKWTPPADSEMITSCRKERILWSVYYFANRNERTWQRHER